MTRLRRTAVAAIWLAGCWAAAIVASAAGIEPAARIDDLAWLAGHWVQDSSEFRGEEHWLAPDGGIMIGVGRTVRGQRTSFEFLRIAPTDKGLVYFASPQGRPPTEFPLKTLEPKRVVFENPAHDFPQSISYWLDERGELWARVEGTIRGQRRGENFHWKRAR